MPKVHKLTISTNYVPNWDIWSAIREVIQNARDEEVKNDTRMEVEYKPRRVNGKQTGGLIVTNHGSTMPLKALILGESSKTTDDRLIGQYGEGFKLALLVLLRNNLKVKIRNGSDVWEPFIDWDKDYEANLLHVKVSEGRNFNNRVSVEIIGVDEDDYNQAVDRCLFLTKKDPLPIDVQSGQILVHPEFKGKIFSKGMYVHLDPDLNYGYNFKHVDLDRDRRMVNFLTHETSCLLVEAANQGDLIPAIYKLIDSQSNDTQSLKHLTYRLNDAALTKMTEQFNETYPDAVPVMSEEQAAELSHFGLRGVKTSDAIYNIVSQKLGDFGTNLNKLRMNMKYEYTLDELDESELTNFTGALMMVKTAATNINLAFNSEHCKVVDFYDGKLLGTYCADDNSVRIARKVLQKRSAVMRILIHEIAHQRGADGHKSHEETIGNLTEAVFDLMFDT